MGTSGLRAGWLRFIRMLACAFVGRQIGAREVITVEALENCIG